MKPIEFCYWLQGFAEITGCEHPNVPQWEVVIAALKTVELKDYPETTLLRASNFVTWLKGYVEISQVGAPNEHEWSIIKEHLQLVFVKVTSAPEKVAQTAKDKTFEEIVKEIKDDMDKKEGLPYQPWPKPYPPGAPWGPIFCASDRTTEPAFICNASKEELPGS